MKELLEKRMYDEPLKGISCFSANSVTIIGEQRVILDDGREVEQYIYTIDGYVPENGKPFVSLKANIYLR